MPFARSAALAAIVLLTAAAGVPAMAQTNNADTPAPAQPAAETDPSKIVVARTGDDAIPLADVAAMRQEPPPQYRQMPLPAISPALPERATDGTLVAGAPPAATPGQRGRRPR